MDQEAPSPLSMDLALVSEIVDRADRLMYQADNFSDRTEFKAAREACDRVEERMIRLVAYFEVTRDRISALGEEEALVVEHIGETLGSEWDVERDKAGVAV
jgi:hypothetical protein